MRKKRAKVPPERRLTLRQEILLILAEGPATARELSARMGISEKEVAPHLEHLRRSLRRTERPLRMEPAACLSCGYVFSDRTRLTKPSACPACRRQHIEPPVFSLGPVLVD